MITKAEAIKILKSWIGATTPDSWLATLEMAIEALEKKGDWVSVREKLPTTPKPVLVNLNWFCQPDNNEVTIMEYWGDYTENCPEEERGWGMLPQEAVVTHWMELPEPPKEAEYDK